MKFSVKMSPLFLGCGNTYGSDLRIHHFLEKLFALLPPVKWNHDCWKCSWNLFMTACRLKIFFSWTEWMPCLWAENKSALRVRHSVSSNFVNFYHFPYNFIHIHFYVCWKPGHSCLPFMLLIRREENVDLRRNWILCKKHTLSSGSFGMVS